MNSVQDAYVVRHSTHQSERFDPVRLHGSILHACMAVRTLEGEAHDTAELVCKHVIEWLHDKTEVSTADIQRITGQYLQTYHPEAAYLYEQQGLIL